MTYGHTPVADLEGTPLLKGCLRKYYVHILRTLRPHWSYAEATLKSFTVVITNS